MSFYQYRPKNTIPEPWTMMPEEGHLPYKCDECGEEFERGYRFHLERGAETYVCNDCLYSFVREKATEIGGKFLRSDEDIFDEYLEWWFAGMMPELKRRAIRKAYEEEKNKDFLEPEFAENHKYYFDWAMEEMEGEEL